MHCLRHDVHHAGELDKQAVTSDAMQATVVLGRFGVDRVSAMAAKGGARASFVGAKPPRLGDPYGQNDDGRTWA